MDTDGEQGTADDGGRRAEREVRSDRRMSDVEAMMWNVEKDPFLSSTFGNITVLDGPLDVGRYRRRLLRATVRIPRLRQRVVAGLGRLAPPEWQDDPAFDIDFHLRHVALPPPGSDRQLYDLATRLVHQPFDRTRPLWEYYVVEGLSGGRAALIQKMHHTITDGKGGIRMSEQFIDLRRDEPDIDEVEVPRPEASGHRNLLETTAETLGHGMRRSLGVGQRAVSATADLATHPTKLAHLGPDLVETARSALRQVTITDRAHSPLWTERSLRRHLEVLDVDFDEAHRAAKALGGSLNDIFVAGAARGAGAYHRELGAPIDGLRMAMPVSTRTDRSAGGNSFVPTRVVVPTDLDDPVEQLRCVHELLGATKREKVIGLVDAMAGIVNVLPTSVVIRLTRQQVETIDFTTSNVRAAPFDLYIAGALILANYPLGPLGGTAFNLTTMSYRGVLNMGLHVDLAAVTDPALLRDCLRESYAELVAAGS